VMAQGARMSFDRRTHRQSWRRYDRLSYFYLAAKVLESTSPQHITDDVVEHLVEARGMLEHAWGKMDFSRLASTNVTLVQFEEAMQARFSEKLGQELERR
jgi:hypothetical protein